MAKKASVKKPVKNAIKPTKVVEVKKTLKERIESGELYSGRHLKIQQDSYRTYSTGSLMLDIALCCKDPITGLYGVPERTKLEILGGSQSVKSGLGEQLLKNVLIADPKNSAIVYLTEEIDMRRYESVGIDIDRIHVIYQDHRKELKDNLAETNFDAIKRLVHDDPNIKLVFIDALAGIVPSSQIFDDPEADVMTSYARSEFPYRRASLVGRFLYEFDKVNQRAILCMTNHLCSKVKLDKYSFDQNSEFDVPTLCGKEVRYACDVRLLSQANAIKSKEKHSLSGKEVVTGWDVSWRVIKNKHAEKHVGRVAQSQFFLDPPGFKRAFDIVNCAIYLGIVEQSGTWLQLGDIKAQGRDNFIEAVEKSNPALLEDIEKMLGDRSSEIFDLKIGKDPMKKTPQDRGRDFENKRAEKRDGKKQPMSGAGWSAKNDYKTVDALEELKSTTKDVYKLLWEDIKKVIRNAMFTGRIGIMRIDLNGREFIVIGFNECKFRKELFLDHIKAAGSKSYSLNKNDLMIVTKTVNGIPGALHLELGHDNFIIMKTEDYERFTENDGAGNKDCAVNEAVKPRIKNQSRA